jgi:hypothetical protein
MQRVYRRIVNDVRRTDKLPWAAIKKVEVTFNPQREDFHPHLHLLVRDEASARAVLERWLQQYPDANRGAQDVRAADPSSVLAELFKYLTKLVVKLDGKVKLPPAWALDNIFVALRGLRTVQPSGFRIAKAEDAEDVQDGDGDLELTATIRARVTGAQWDWHPSLTDWVDLETGECLTSYEPSAAMAKVLAQVRASYAVSLGHIDSS